MVWGLVATVIATLLPVWESRVALINILKHLTGQGGALPSKQHPPLDTPVDADKPVQAPPKLDGDDTAHGGPNKFNV